MEWMAALAFLSDDNLQKILNDYTIATGVAGALVGYVVNRTQNKTDDSIWQRIKDRFRPVPK